MDRAGGRQTTEVAVGVLLRADGAVLLADRPAGKPYPGYWEFPGGKIEPGESIEHALARELHEELGIDIGPAARWVSFEFDYPHAYVRLHFCRVYDWRGTPQGREGQRLAFFRLDAALPQPLLPAAVPALRWLALPDLAATLPVGAQPAAVLPWLDRLLARGLRLVFLRAAAGTGPSGFAQWLPTLRARAAAHAARLVVDAALSGAGDRLLAAGADAAAARAASASDWLGAAVDDARQLHSAARSGCDFVLHGPVLPAAGEARAAVGWHGARALLDSTPLPVFLEGGLTAADLAHARALGAHGVVIDGGDS